jgi:hypothetical protein
MTRMPRKTLFKLIEWYIPKWLPIDTRSRAFRKGTILVGFVPCWNFTGKLPLGPNEIVSWAILDPFDALAPKYDKPQTLESVTRWFQEARLSEVQVMYEANGIVGNGVKG